MKYFAFLIGFAILLTGSLAFAQQATLRTAITVQDDYIRLGDLFENAGEKALVNIAYAPAPGRRAVFDAQWLFNVARAYGLNWRPLSLRTRAVVERESQVIHREEIEEKLIAALIARGVDKDAEIVLSNRNLKMYVPTDRAATIGIEALTFDPDSSRFTATVASPADDPAARRIRVTGRIHKMVEIPVLIRRVAASKVIGKRDVTWMRVRANRVRQETVTDIEQIVGMAAKRSIRAGKPIRISEVRRPLMVPKGSLVTLEIRTPFMMLTVRGKALDEGSKGDVIRVANGRSKRVVEATVVGIGRVYINPSRRVAVN